MKRLILYIAIGLVFCTPVYAQDYTSKVKNTQTAWGGTGTYTAGSISCAEYYNDSHFYHNTFNQTVSNLPVGVYEAEVYFNASCAAWNCEPIVADGTTSITHFFANDAEIDVPVQNIKSITSPTLYTISGIHVTDGTLRLGARNDKEGANWHIVRLMSLTRIGTDSASLYGQLLTLVRQARKALLCSTCDEHSDALRSAIDAAMEVAPTSDVASLQAIITETENEIAASTAFETEKSEALGGIAKSLLKFQIDCNTGIAYTPEHWQQLLSFVVAACIAKDSETDLETIIAAKHELDNAMQILTGITSSPFGLVNETDALKTDNVITTDGRHAHPFFHGIVIKNGHKVFKH